MDVVLMGRLGHGWNIGPYSRRDKEAAQAVLELVGLKNWAIRPFSSLSGGQRQRLLIARALACDPELLLMDEPTAHLDLVGEGEFYELLKALNERMTIVLVSHDLGFVSALVRSVVCVKRQVMMHATSDITGEVINEMYGSPMKMVRHDRGDSGVIQKCLSS
jgi:zinc transport system ATP-binding protein